MSGCAFSISSKQDDAVGIAADPLGELAALLVADVARGRADQLRDGVLLHVLRHVEAHERLLVLEQELGEAPRDLGLPDARGPEEDEGAHRAVRVVHAQARAADRLGDADDRGVLADDAAAQASLPCGGASRPRPSRATATGMSVQERDDLLDVAAGDFLRRVALLGRCALERSISSLSSISRSRRNTAFSKSLSEIAFFISLTICADLELELAEVLRVGHALAASPWRRPRRGCRSPCPGRSGR